MVKRKERHVEDWEKHIHALLGDVAMVSDENALRYRTYLKTAFKLPLRVTGREDFPWEEPYVLGEWSQSEYTKLKKTNPSHTDTFDLIEILPPDENCDLIAKIKRVSDKRVFEVGLSWLTTKIGGATEYKILDHYATWIANF